MNRVTTDRWLVFAGDWTDEDFVYHRTEYDSYHEARGVLAAHLARFLTDTCRDCQAASALALRRLFHLDVGSEFAVDVDGADYLLIRPARIDIDDLTVARPEEPCPRCSHPLGFAHLFGACFYSRCDCPDPYWPVIR
jgi:hypothetical protein